ncbi:hypothetical protein [Ectothiorhodospira mobilis]|uniref:hypothetical protein n=1 Tax=Ectothiorhodospira mobilis TaxID=195064 RepID=UPI001EE7ACA2|nr:hypothetical protein [Ectothiorhodospira mobilis]MCG5534678.1 hypothetical protein [Ectothiorhodospira mobilis]
MIPTGSLCPFALFMLAILVGTLLPAHRLPSWLPNDKLLHVLAHGLAAILLILALPPGQGRWIGLLLLFLTGWLLEHLQRYVPGRGYSRGDLAANALGIAGGLTGTSLAGL